MTTAIVWLRRDLRIDDSPALNHALAESERVIPLYIHAPEEESPWQPGAASRWWLHHSLKALEASLRRRGSGLVIRRGASGAVLREVAKEAGAGVVCWNRLYEPSARSRDGEIKKILAGAGIRTEDHPGSLLREPWEVAKDDGTPYRVFTPFWRRYLLTGPEAGPQDGPAELPPLPRGLGSLSAQDLDLIPGIPWYREFGDHWQPGEAGAMARFGDFLGRSAVFEYGQGRDLPGQDGVSGLSAHLHFGEITARRVWHDVLRAAGGFEGAGEHGVPEQVRPFLRQLAWRDFAHHILFHEPETTEAPFDRRYESFVWDENPELLLAWQQGRTGIPLVDAGMRQLWRTGWMHNRIRMLAASVLTKNGLVHWLHGARWFWDTLVDADLANNTMGWQWTAGCGVDAAPYFRVFSPARQGERFDSRGDYVRTWVPELAAMPSWNIHEPWRAPESMLRQAGVVLGEDYPHPVVNLAAGRAEALRRFRAIG